MFAVDVTRMPCINRTILISLWILLLIPSAVLSSDPNSNRLQLIFSNNMAGEHQPCG
jgi:hypothetical protein